MRKLLLASALVALPLLPAHAILTVSGTDNGGLITFACAPGNPSASGAIVCTAPSDANFTTLSLIAAGVPNLASPNLASLTLDAVSAVAGTRDLVIDVVQTGVSATPAAMDTTGTVNNLVGGPFGPTTLSAGFNGSLTNLLNNNFGTVTTGTKQVLTPVGVLVTSDQAHYDITFTAAGQTATDTIQMVTPAPEPASLALLATGLVGLGAVARRRRSI